MPFIFYLDETDSMKFMGYASVPLRTDSANDYIIDDLGPDDLPGGSLMPVLVSGIEAFVQQDGQGSRHATSDLVTLGESETEYNEEKEDEPL